MGRPSALAISASPVLAVGLAMMGHEAAHVVTGWMAGGSPTLMTATEVRGDFGSLSALGLVIFGFSGSLYNLLLAALGGWLASRPSTGQPMRLVAWFFFGVNGMLAFTKMMAEPLAGFGDWMTILRPLPRTPFLRLVAAGVGTAGVIFLVRRSGALLGAMIPGDDPVGRKAQGRRIVLLGAAASSALVLASCVSAPVGTVRGALLALGAGLGPFLPLFFGFRFVPRTPPGRPVEMGRLAPLLVATGATAVLMVLLVGPGIHLSAP